LSLAPLLAVLVVVMLAASAGAEITGGRPGSAPRVEPRATIRDTNLNFTLELPAGFVAAPDVLRRNPSMLHAYALGRRDSNGVSITLMIERLNRTLRPNERVRASQIPKDMAGELLTAQWNGLTVDNVLAQKKYGHRTYLAYHVRIPLQKEAIQLELVGPATRKDELDAILRKLLGGLQGESNWTPVAAAGSAGGTGAGGSDVCTASPRTVMIGVAVVGFIAAVPLFWPRRPRRATVMPTHAPPTHATPPPPLAPISAPSTGGATPPPLPPRPPNS
jgi:hypothetical protein